MRINQINNQAFKAIYRHSSAKFSPVQEEIAKKITSDCLESSANYNDRSIVELLETDYKMDICIDSHADQKSVTLYYAEDCNLNDYKGLKKLNPIGVYNDENRFCTEEIIEDLDRINFQKGSGIINTVATILFAIAAVAIPVVSAIALVKEHRTPKVENVINKANDTLKTVTKDSLNILK